MGTHSAALACPPSGPHPPLAPEVPMTPLADQLPLRLSAAHFYLQTHGSGGGRHEVAAFENCPASYCASSRDLLKRVEALATPGDLTALGSIEGRLVNLTESVRRQW